MLTLAQVAGDQAAAASALNTAAFADYRRGLGHLSPPDDSWFRIAVAEGTVWWVLKGADRVGVAVLSQAGSTLTIDSLCVATGRQSEGLGRLALEAVEAHARQAGATEIRLHTAQIYTRLVAFYSRAGYRVSHVGPHPKGRDDRFRVFMVKSL